MRVNKEYVDDLMEAKTENINNKILRLDGTSTPIEDVKLG